MDLTSACLRAV